WLENRAKRLIGADGSFSQYSVNYHRMMLDTLSFSETFRQWFSLEPFSHAFYERARAATNWLAAMTDPKSGDVPNLGANDGARLFPLTETDYRDYRPSLIWAYKVFSDSSPLNNFANANECTAILTWLGLEQVHNSAALPTNIHFKDGGFVVLNSATARLVVNYPRFKFRPSQNDLLHIDLWVKSENLLRDAGSYSYNCEEPWQSYFPSTAAHNTIRFDGRDQMPRISRFLLGAWPKAKDVVFRASDDSETKRFTCGFKDYCGAVHYRAIDLQTDRLIITDTVSGFTNKAVARFRLTSERKWQ
ncbi:heparinase II/III family protein, partial [Idiomarina abyssalis]|uniref:heparinase II/III family protein n=3 Tax=Idiomarinaceae TaxID=267893 RepID=UPI00241E25E2